MPPGHSNPFFGAGKTRAEALRQMSPHLIAYVYLYPTADGGKKVGVHPGWGCPCSTSKSTEAGLYDGWPLLEGSALAEALRMEPFVPAPFQQDSNNSTGYNASATAGPAPVPDRPGLLAECEREPLA